MKQSVTGIETGMSSGFSAESRYSHNPFTLRFDPSLENEFSQWYFDRNVRVVRIAFIIAAFLYSSFGILDANLAPEVKSSFWLIRFAFFLPVSFAAFLSTFSKSYRKLIQPVSAFMILAAGFGIVYMIAIASAQARFTYYAGLMLVLMYSYSFMRMKFILASAVGLAVIAAYEVGALVVSPIPPLTLLSNNFFLLSTNLIGMAAAYAIEYFNRQSFVQSKIIEDEQWNLKRLSQQLSKRVAERTAQLDVINRELRDEVAEHQSVARELKRSEIRYRQIIENITEGYIELDGEGKIIFFNDALIRISGRSSDDLKRKHARWFIKAESRPALIGAIQRLSRTTKPSLTVNFAIERPNGEERVLEISVSLIRDQSGASTGYRGLVRDVTDRMLAENELKRAKEAAVEANSAKSVFLANMSHELRTPLNHIIGFSELVLDKRFGSLNEKQAEFITDVLGSSKHLLSLINDILDISKIEAGKIELHKEIFPVRQFLEECVAMIKDDAIKRYLATRLDVDESVDYIFADRKLLKQVMFNLLSNAAKFSPDKSEITVSAQRSVCPMENGAEDERGRRFSSGDRQDCPDGKSCVKISVTDEGIGIDPEDRDSIFKRFVQVDSSIRRNFPGTGLGLALARGIVDLHEGRLWVDSEGEGKGSTFSLLIPML